jgi:membrane protein implicated in regulation of membrane protease activity
VEPTARSNSQTDTTLIKFVAVAGVGVIAAVLLQGWAAYAGFFAVLVLFYLVPKLKISPQGKLIAIVTIIAIVAGIRVAEILNERQEHLAEENAAQESARRTGEEQKLQQQQFNAMTPAEHLAQARQLLQPGATPQAESIAYMHIAAIPTDAPEARSATALKSRFERNNARKLLKPRN